MGDKNKTFAVPTQKGGKMNRPSTVGVASTSSRNRTPTTAAKDRYVNSRPKASKNLRNITLIGEGDVPLSKQDVSMPDFDSEYRQIAYGKFLRAMLEDCLVDEKIEREETQMDIEMTLLADRFQKTMDQLDKTNKRLKDISFVAEQKRLLDLKNQDHQKFTEITDNPITQDLLKDLTATEQECLDKLETKNIDFGYDKESGHNQLLDTVNDAIEALDQIKKHSNLDIENFKGYEKVQKNLQDIEKDRLDLETLKAEFEAKFPNFGEKLLKLASEKMTKMIENDEEDE